MPVVGIPRALYYFHFHPLWESFLTGLGFEVVVSPPRRTRKSWSGGFLHA